MYGTEPEPWFVFGPYIRNMFGKPETVVPRKASGESPQVSSSERPSSAVNVHGRDEARCVEARAPDDRVGLALHAVGADDPGRGDPLDGAVQQVDVRSAFSVEYQSLVKRTRLQPIS